MTSASTSVAISARGFGMGRCDITQQATILSILQMSGPNKETVDGTPALPLAPRVDILARRNVINAFEKDWRDIQEMVRDNVRTILMEAPDPRNE